MTTVYIILFGFALIILISENTCNARGPSDIDSIFTNSKLERKMQRRQFNLDNVDRYNLRSDIQHYAGLAEEDDGEKTNKKGPKKGRRNKDTRRKTTSTEKSTTDTEEEDDTSSE